MTDSFKPLTPNDILDSKIQIVGILINRFEEQIEFAKTLDPKTLTLQKAEWIINDLEDIVKRIRDLKK